MSKKPDFLIYADGACSGNPGPGGWACVVARLKENSVVELAGFEKETTNNKMEMTAAGRALVEIEKEKGTVWVCTDSSYVIRGVTQWIKGWKSRGWKKADGGEVANVAFWQRLEALVEKRGGGVEFLYVPGHSGVPGNDRCDELAVACSKGAHPGLYNGTLSDYRIDLFATLPDDPKKAKPPERDGHYVEKARPIYMSLVDGKPERHETWPECEARVKGRSGARYKKCANESEVEALLKAWGIN